MPVLLNSIDNFQFIDLAGGVEQLKQIVEQEQRPGVDGTELRTLGLKGRPFTIRSKCDAFNVADAQQAFYDYAQLVGQIVPLVQYGTDYTRYGLGFAVLDVRPVSVRAVLFVIGGVFGGQGWIEADWSLLPMAL